MDSWTLSVLSSINDSVQRPIQLKNMLLTQQKECHNVPWGGWRETGMTQTPRDPCDSSVGLLWSPASIGGWKLLG